MEQNEREMKNSETLARIDQQLQDSVKNQTQIMSDLKEIFQRIEKDSKVVTTLSENIRGLVDNMKLRWDGLDRQMQEMDRRIKSLEDCHDDNEKAISLEREERIKAVDEEVKEREKFQQEVNSSVKTVGWVVGIIATLASIFSGIVLLFQVLGKLKGVG